MDVNQKPIQKENKSEKDGEIDKRPWYKNYYTLALIAILLITFGIRFYFLASTWNTAEFWDSTEYGSAAKHIALGTPQWIGTSRGILWPMMTSPLFFFGSDFGEHAIKILEILFCVGCIFLIYLLAKKLYNEKVALFSATTSSVFWVTIFWGIRNTVDIPSMFFMILACYFGYKFIENPSLKDQLLFLASLVIAVLIKQQSILIAGPFVLTMMIVLRKKLKLIGIGICIIALIGGFIEMLRYYPPNLTFPIQWGILSFIPLYLQTIWTVIFCVGAAYVFYCMIITFDKADESKETRAGLFLFLILAVWYTFFAFYIRSADDRWLIMTSVPIFILLGKGFEIMYNTICKIDKKNIIATCIVIGILLMGCGGQIAFANDTVMTKKDAYMQVKSAALWMKDNSVPSDIIISASKPQTAFYAERETHGFEEGILGGELNYTTEEGMEKIIKEIKPRYFVISLWEPSPQWALMWPANHNETVYPVQAYFMDAQQTQPSLIIYAFKDYNIT